MSERLRAALQRLVDVLDEIGASPALTTVFAVAATHGIPYRGPNWTQALKEAKQALKEAKQALAEGDDEREISRDREVEERGGAGSV